MKTQEALKLAREALENAWLDASMGKGDVARHTEAIAAIREALASGANEQPAPSSHLTDEQKAANGLAWLARLEAMREEFAGLAEQPAQQQEPVAYMDVCEKGQMSDLRFWSEPDNRHQVPLYTSPPASKPLTDEQIERIFVRYGGDMMNCARAIEREHGIKGDA